MRPFFIPILLKGLVQFPQNPKIVRFIEYWWSIRCLIHFLEGKRLYLCYREGNFDVRRYVTSLIQTQRHQ